MDGEWEAGQATATGRPWLWWLVLGGMVLAFLAAPGLLPDKLMAVAAGVCPQRPSHSYFLAGTQLPLEARMLGIFGGFLGTMLYAWTLGEGRRAPLPSSRRFWALMAPVALMAADGLNATAYDLGLWHLYAPLNAVRLATGLLTGIAVALLFLPVCNAWTWGTGETRPSQRPWAEVGGPLAIAALIWLMAVAGWAWAFYPLALLAIGGLVLAVGMLNLLLLLALGWHGSKIAGLAELAPYGVLSLVLAGAELAALAALRYAMLGASPM